MCFTLSVLYAMVCRIELHYSDAWLTCYHIIVMWWDPICNLFKSVGTNTSKSHGMLFNFDDQCLVLCFIHPLIRFSGGFVWFENRTSPLWWYFFIFRFSKRLAGGSEIDLFSNHLLHKQFSMILYRVNLRYLWYTFNSYMLTQWLVYVCSPLH